MPLKQKPEVVLCFQHLWLSCFGANQKCIIDVIQVSTVIPTTVLVLTSS